METHRGWERCTAFGHQNRIWKKNNTPSILSQLYSINMAREILYAMYIGHGNIHGWQTEDFSRDLFTPLSTLTLITHRQWWSNWTRTSKMTKFNGHRTSVWYSYKPLLVNSLKTGPISKNTSLHRLWHYGNGLEHPDHLRRSMRRCPESLGTVRQGASRWWGRRWGW